MPNNIARIQRALRQAHLDAILLTNENDRRFATGFPSSDGTVIVTVHQAFFITDSRYIEAANAALTGIAQVLLCSREAPMRTLVQGILREANVQLLGAEEQTTSYAEFTAYEQLLGLKLQPAQSILRTLRAAKQPEELAMMYQAQQITDETFAQICTVIRPGMTEREIAAELIYRMLRLGAEGTSFDPIVLTGPNTSMPHGVPGDRRVADGDFVTMDFGCRKNGYCSDMTRTVAVGMPSDEMRTVYQTVLDAQLAGIAAAKAGVEYVEIGISGRGTVAEIREKALHAKRMADEAGLKVWSCHLPFSRKLDISVLNDSARMANLEFLTEMIAICGEVGPEKLVLHPSSEPIADGEREQRIRNSIASIGILRREAARIGAQLCIEDLPRTCLGRNSAELLRIIAPYPEVKICFDTNHLLSEDLLHFVEACGDRIATVHVSDYDMVDERHWLPGKGKIDWPALYGALMKAGYKGVFMYELKRGEGSFGEMVAIYEKLASDAAKLE